MNQRQYKKIVKEISVKTDLSEGLVDKIITDYFDLALFEAKKSLDTQG